MDRMATDVPIEKDASAIPSPLAEYLLQEQRAMRAYADSMCARGEAVVE
jgi:hypothetical protein